MSTDPIVLSPLYELGNEANCARCLRQLEAAGEGQADLNKFAYWYGYHNMEGTHTGRAIESAAEECGYEVRWEHQKDDD